ncbi:MAG: glycogen synthase, partial [Burkholderiaceae bacterium]
DWQPDVLHAHDWHAALSMAYLNQHPVKTVRRIFTIHNLAYQGRFDLATGPRLMIDPDLLTPQHLEFHGELSFMKAGIDGADCITTVSPTYASEILTPAFGEGLDGMLRHHKTRLTGILNGVDADQWNPKSDTALWSTYDDKSFSQKVKNKTELRKQVGLANMESSRPLFGVVSRLTNQKGQDLILEAIPSLVMNNCQLVVLGAGDHGIEKAFRRYANLHPDNISFVQGYDETLAHQIFGGADSILVPSEFEPCGLTQLYGLRYGSVPIVRRVGGLADTVHDVLYNQPVASGMSAANIGNGFSFQKRSDFVPTLLRAIELYQESELWQELAVKGMREDHGWQHAANEYLRLYKATAI